MTSSLHSGIGRRRRKSGAALIIVLALLVLITALMAIFLSRALIERKVAASSASGNSASILARSAVDMITGDLRQEIVNGSTGTIVGPSTNQTTLYFPISPTNMVPLRAGYATNSAGVDAAPNLVRRSYRFDTNALTVPSRASAINSYSDASYNGRSIALSRWNSHYLIPRASAGSSTIDSTPVSAFVAPDWVMVATNGPTVMATPSPAAIGRYAYAIYDEGGLLDANVAGCPSGMTTYLPSQFAGKGSLALADLTAIGLTATDIDNLVGWRNYATAQPASGSFGSYNLGTDANASTNYYSYVSSNTNAFLVVNPRQFNSRTDQTFSSRQALLKYQRASGFSQDALQYLGTFSRDLEQPSFQPDPGRSKNHYLLDADNSNDTCGTTASNNTTGANQDLINPSLLTVRDATGSLVLKRRFPLSRLSILEQAQDTLRTGGTLTTTQVNQVYDYFGLTWDSSNLRWTYGHGDGTTIFRLSQIPTTVAAANPDGTAREPDFFEILKAVINCDSLGKQQAALDLNTSVSPHGPNGSLIDGQIHYQLIQIGANLIDQYDSDSYPTCIYFNGSAICGVENLPYMAGWEIMWYQMNALNRGTDINTAIGTPPTSGTTYQSTIMLQPILWNPHAPATTTVPGPTSFRVVAGSMADVAIQVYPKNTGAGSTPAKWSWWTFSAFPPAYPATAAYASANSMTAATGTANAGLYIFPKATVDPAVAMINFNSGAGGAAFLEPYRLHTLNDPPNSNAQNDPGYAAGQITIGADPSLVSADGGSTKAIGFFAGNCWTGPNTGSLDHSGNYLSMGTLSNDLKFSLQYKSPTGTWQTYDTIDDVYASAGINSTIAMTAADSPPNTRGFMTCFKVDPRTDRWGCYHMATFPSTGSTTLPIGVTPNPSTSGTSSNGPWDNGVTAIKSPPLYNLPENTTLGPSANGSYMMVGNNTGGAAAVGWVSSNPIPSDLSVVLAPSTSAPPAPNAGVGTSTTAVPGAKLYYCDGDGVIRRATGGNFSGNDGLPEYTANNNSRPVVLNRPFRSVAEMGYAFRGQAWKQLDFANPESGDSALLEAFCLNEVANAPADTTVAGRVNLNTRQSVVLQALLQGVSKAEGGTISNTEAANAAQTLVSWTTANPSIATNQTAGVFNRGPLRNRAELVGKFVSQVIYSKPTLSMTGGQTPILDGSKTYSGYSSMLNSPGVFASTSDASIERRRECVMRALTDSGNTRTWNLLIDVIAQTGRYAPSAKTAADLPKFIVNGESRYWVHVAIDRYTGAIISESFEPVED